MCADLSTENPSRRALRVAAALLRGCGGTTVYLQIPPTAGDTADAGQLGIDAPNLKLIPLSPAVFHKNKNSDLVANQPQKYELRISADSVASQVAQLQLADADALFALASGVVVSGSLFLIEGYSSLEQQGQIYLYRLLLRDAITNWTLQDPDVAPQD